MRLISTKIKNYRIHCGDHPLEINFDPSMQLIHGPNEAGKSTVMNAIHDALFVKARGNAGTRKRMRPHNDSKPEIEVVFESGGNKYSLVKKFTGPNGTCELSITSLDGRRENLAGDDAETKLAEILGRLPQGGRGETPGLWRLCWVHQGESGLNPAAQITPDARASLGQILRAQTGQAIGSAGDALFLKKIMNERDLMMRENGEPRANTDWQKANDLQKSLSEELDKLKNSLEEQHRDFANLKNTTTQLSEIEESIPGYENGIKDMEEQLEKCREIEAGMNTLVSRKMEKGHLLQNAQAQSSRLTRLKSEIEASEKDVDDARAKCDTATQELAASQTDLPKLRSDLERQQNDLEGKISELDLSKAVNEYAALAKGKSQSSALLEKGEDIKKQIVEKERDHSLIKVTSSKLKELNELQSGIAQIAAKIEGASVRVMVKSQKSAHLFINDQEVTADLKAEHGHVVSEPAWVKVGAEDDWVYIQPGGQELAQLKESLQESREEFTAALHKLGVDSLEKAISEDARKTALEQSIAVLKAGLAGICPDGIDVVRRHNDEISDKMGKIANRISDFDPKKAAQGIPKDNITILESAFKNLNKSVAEASTKVQVMESVLEQKKESARVFQEQLDNTNLKAAKLHAEWKVILTEVGDISKLDTKIGLLQKEIEGVQREYEQEEAKRQGLNSADLSEKLNIEQRTLLQLNNEMKTHLERKNTLLGKLSANEGIGLYEQIGSTEAKLNEVKMDVERFSRRGRALYLLGRTLQETQRESTVALLAPLQEKVAPMIGQLFPGATLSFTVDDDGQIALDPIHRNQAADKFEELSKGASEQVGVIIRLGLIMALAKEFGGTLPVILDDALVNSDASRYEELLPILTYAAKELQLIILTCNYPAYRRLGLQDAQVRELQKV